jgi:hypothetical protein
MSRNATVLPYCRKLQEQRHVASRRITRVDGTEFLIRRFFPPKERICRGSRVESTTHTSPPRQAAPIARPGGFICGTCMRPVSQATPTGIWGWDGMPGHGIGTMGGGGGAGGRRGPCGSGEKACSESAVYGRICGTTAHARYRTWLALYKRTRTYTDAGVARSSTSDKYKSDGTAGPGA